MRRYRKAKIIATLGPVSNTYEQINALFHAGADIFRLNFSHGTHEQHQNVYQAIRQVEEKFKRPITILADLQGPKLRVGKFVNDKVRLENGQMFQFDQQEALGDETRVCLPHPEIYAAVKVGDDLLIDDGRLRLRVEKVTSSILQTSVQIGGALSNNKGVNVPGAILNISALTDKDKKDLNFALRLGVDWVALSFVQRAEDVIYAKELIGNQACIISKLEKPSALEHLEEIIQHSEGIMVARGDLGVEMQPEEVPSLQKRIIHGCREAGKPVIVATQMLESMIQAPSPTRAEASDVATAIYEGVDAVMLSAESASGNFSIEAVTMMNKIIEQVETDSFYRQALELSRPSGRTDISTVLTTAARHVINTLDARAAITFTESGSTTFNQARERPLAPLIALTPSLKVARMLGLVWGTHSIVVCKIQSFNDMIDLSLKIAAQEGFAKSGEQIIVLAGMPFGGPGGTNTLQILTLANK